ncbi:hypothetical protein QYE76_040692 [Lolium multiflorum]|uniref:CCHC-type domain-containing protein n=1 Tax=Lolium multiflorum TaxID=4521 RepID=A0AAD8TDH6_LOLMU|nr:hypothetical protein QYE76_040692 [Lolium multiflorum]
MMQLLQTLMADRETDRAERQASIAALQQLANNQHGHGNHDHPGSKLKNFQNTNPPVFSKTEEPLDADDWLQTMENNLEVAGVDENEKVLFATHYLAGLARAWWTSTRAMNAGQMMTWADFKLKFSKYHVPPGLIKKMRDEFRELKQGRMSVVEYRDRFLTLSRYTPDETDTTEKRKERFLNGLHDEMQTVLVNIPFADLEALVDSAIQMEGKLHHANENRKRRMMHQSGPSNTPRTGSNAIPVATKDKATITCYECGVVGHYSNECPKRLAKLAGNTAAPAQQQRRVSTGKKFALNNPNNPNNRGGRLYHMNAEAQEAPDVVLAIQAPPEGLPEQEQLFPGRTTAAAGSLGAEAEKQAWLAKYTTAPVQESSAATTSTADQISAVLRDQFDILPKKKIIGYSKPYPNEFDLIPLPPKYRLPDFNKFSGSEGSSSIEHVSRYLAQWAWLRHRISYG